MPTARLHHFLEDVKRVLEDKSLPPPLIMQRIKELQDSLTKEVEEQLHAFRLKATEKKQELSTVLSPPQLDSFQQALEIVEEFYGAIKRLSLREELLMSWEVQSATAIVADYQTALAEGNPDLVEVFEAEAERVLLRKDDPKALSAFKELKAKAVDARLTPAQRAASAQHSIALPAPPLRSPGAVTALSGFIARLRQIGKGPLLSPRVLSVASLAIIVILLFFLILPPRISHRRAIDVQQHPPHRPHPPPLARTPWTLEAWKSQAMQGWPSDPPPWPAPLERLSPRSPSSPKAAPGPPFDPGPVPAYLAEVKSKVAGLWEPPPLRLPGERSVAVAVRIRPSGQIAAVTITQTSGDAAFDQSALKAVQRARSFPPPPTDAGNTLDFDMELKFHVSREARPLQIQDARGSPIGADRAAQVEGEEIETEYVKEWLQVVLDIPPESTKADGDAGLTVESCGESEVTSGEELMKAPRCGEGSVPCGERCEE